MLSEFGIREGVVNQLNEAFSMQTEAAEEIDAAHVEQQHGRATLSLGLLKEAIEKERTSLEMVAESVENLMQAIEGRRQALDQEREIVDQVISELSGNEATDKTSNQGSA